MMSKKALKVGLMGCGRIAKRHAELLSRDEIKGASLQAVCDINSKAAKYFSEKYNVPYYFDVQEMLKKEVLDILVILTPSGLHAEHVIATSGKISNIVVEKPMALLLSDAEEMIRLTDSHGTKLFVVKQNRYNLPVIQTRKALESGRFGDLILGTVRVRWCRDQDYYDQAYWRGSWKGDGGVLSNQASHHLDLLTWMMGDVKSVHAYASTALVDIETEDTAVATLQFENGAIGTIEATTATRPKDLEGSFSIMGSSGSVEISGFAVNELRHWNFKEALDSDIDVINRYSENPPNVYGFGHKAYYNQVVKSIIEDKNLAVDGKSGFKSLKLLHAVYRSIEDGREVFLSENVSSKLLGK